MNINYFYSNNIHERMELVNRLGKFISRIKYYGFYIQLYQMKDCLVEVYYNIHSNAIEQVELIDYKDPRLEIYANQVDISDAFKTNEN